MAPGRAPEVKDRALTWRGLSPPWRALGLGVTVAQAIGYTTSLIYVWHTTRMVPAGVSTHYRGADSTATEGAMEFPKSFAEMLTITHTHLLSMAAIFALSGACLALCTRPSERWRRFLIGEPFVALLVSFTSMWLMRYGDARFAWLLEASSALMALTFYTQTWFILAELRAVARADRAAAP